MKKIFVVGLTLVAFIFTASSSAELSTSFHPDSGVTTYVTVTKKNIDYSVITSSEPTHAQIPLDIESQPHLNIEDFNFDGHQDFSVWYLDEGMGTYTIHRVFIYKPKSKVFIEAAPNCGDQFLNLKVNKTKRSLISSYISDNHSKLCQTQLKFLK